MTFKVIQSSNLILAAASAIPFCLASIAITIQTVDASSSAAPTSTAVSANPNPNPTSSTAAATTSDSKDDSKGGKVSISKEEFSKAVFDSYPDAKSKINDQMLDTKYKAFTGGLNKSTIETKKEAAMFLAQALHESGGLIYTKEIICQTNLEKCKADYKAEKQGANTGKVYYGRGYLQLTHDYNYYAASMALYNDDRLIKDPDQVGDKDEVAWAVSFWFWDANVHKAPGVKEGKFGAATNAINGKLECVDKSNPEAVKKRNANYEKCLKAFGISDAPDTSGCG